MAYKSMNKLLKKALEESEKGLSKSKVTRDHVELILAYLNDEITVRGVAMAMSLESPGSVTHRVSHILRVGLEKGWLKITLTPPEKTTSDKPGV